MARQIVDTIWQEVIEGTLDTGQRMPTVRLLAVELGLSPRTILRAYERLEQLGVLTKRPGEGTCVSLAPADPAERERWKRLERLCEDTITQAEQLDFTVNDVIDTLNDFRSHT